jgi:hypothetical protein
MSTANGIRPAIAVIPQATIDTRPGPGVDRLLPGVNVDASWEIRKDHDNIEAVVASNRVAPLDGSAHFEIATGITNAILFHDRFEVFTEWDVYAPTQQSEPTRQYAIGGLVVFASHDLALDVRVGTGLNHAASGFVFGTGFAVRPRRR